MPRRINPAPCVVLDALTDAGHDATPTGTELLGSDGLWRPTVSLAGVDYEPLLRISTLLGHSVYADDAVTPDGVARRSGTTVHRQRDGSRQAGGPLALDEVEPMRPVHDRYQAVVQAHVDVVNAARAHGDALQTLRAESSAVALRYHDVSPGPHATVCHVHGADVPVLIEDDPDGDGVRVTVIESVSHSPLDA